MNMARKYREETGMEWPEPLNGLHMDTPVTDLVDKMKQLIDTIKSGYIFGRKTKGLRGRRKYEN